MDRDRRLAELMGMCGWYCTKCDKPLRPAEVTYEENCLYCGLHLSDPDFTLPEWRAKLRDFCCGWDEWPKFIEWAYDKYCPDTEPASQRAGDFMNHIWRNLPDLIVEYHGEGR